MLQQILHLPSLKSRDLPANQSLRLPIPHFPAFRGTVHTYSQTLPHAHPERGGYGTVSIDLQLTSFHRLTLASFVWFACPLALQNLFVHRAGCFYLAFVCRALSPFPPSVECRNGVVRPKARRARILACRRSEEARLDSAEAHLPPVRPPPPTSPCLGTSIYRHTPTP